jgi:hypothetical protein
MLRNKECKSSKNETEILDLKNIMFELKSSIENINNLYSEKKELMKLKIEH